MKKKLLAAFLAAGFSAGFAAADDEKKPAQNAERAATRDADGKAPADKLIGTFAIEKGMENGKEIPAERLKDSVVTITKDKIVGVSKDKSQLFVASYTVETAPEANTDPNKKDFIRLKMKSEKPAEAEATGLAKVEKDKVTIIYNMPKGKPPTDFELQEGQHLFVLKRMEKTEGGTKPEGENK